MCRDGFIWKELDIPIPNSPVLGHGNATHGYMFLF